MLVTLLVFIGSAALSSSLPAQLFDSQLVREQAAGFARQVGLVQSAASDRVSAQVVEQLEQLGLLDQFRCLGQCGARYADVWQRALGVASSASPAASVQQLIAHAGNLSVAERAQLFESVCETYTDYEECVVACPKDLLRDGIESGLTSLRVLCGDKHDAYLAVMPCLVEQQAAMRAACQAENDRAAVSQMQMSSAGQLRVDASTVQTALRDVCSAASKQAACSLRAVGELCGTDAAALAESLMAQSLNATAAFLRRTSAVALPDECAAALRLADRPVSPKPTVDDALVSDVLQLLEKADEHRTELDAQFDELEQSFLPPAAAAAAIHVQSSYLLLLFSATILRVL